MDQQDLPIKNSIAENHGDILKEYHLLTFQFKHHFFRSPSFSVHINPSLKISAKKGAEFAVTASSITRRARIGYANNGDLHGLLNISLADKNTPDVNFSLANVRDLDKPRLTFQPVKMTQ